MTKVTGRTDRFSLINTKGNRTIVGYEREAVDEVNSTWHEVSFSKDHSEKPSIEQVRTAIIADIDARTDEKILDGYEWTVIHGDDNGAHVGETVRVWLSAENQNNFKEAHRLASADPTKIIPVRFKISEDADKKAVYETFHSFEELNAFYLGAFAYIKGLLDDGWAKKDSFDFSPYEQALNPQPERV